MSKWLKKYFSFSKFKKLFGKIASEGSKKCKKIVKKFGLILPATDELRKIIWRGGFRDPPPPPSCRIVLRVKKYSELIPNITGLVVVF